MKKIVLSMAVLALGFSCSKENLQNQPMGDIKNSSASENENQKIIDKIVGFKAQLDEKNLNTTFSVEDAIWNIEALANYVFDAPTKEMESFEYDTLTFTIEKQNGVLAFNKVSEMYNSIYSTLNNLAKKNKFIRLIDVALKEENQTSVTLTAVPFIAKNNENSKSVFGATDFWFWGLGAGKCGAFSGNIGMDATDVIPRQLVPLAWPENYCFSSVNTVQMHGSDVFFDNNPIANPFGFENTLNYKRFGTGTPNNSCLSPAMLDFYRTNLATIGNIWNNSFYKLPGFPSNQTITGYDLQSDLLAPSGSFLHLHNPSVTYASLTIKPSGGLGF